MLLVITNYLYSLYHVIEFNCGSHAMVQCKGDHDDQRFCCGIEMKKKCLSCGDILN